MFGWFKRLFAKKPQRKEYDPVLMMTVLTAFQSGRPVVTSVDENGKVTMSYMDEDESVGGERSQTEEP